MQRIILQSDVRTWIQERLSTIPAVHVGSADHCLADTGLLIGVLKEVMATLQPCETISRFFSEIGVDYFKVASSMETQVGDSSN